MERATEMILEIGKPVRDMRPWMSAIFFSWSGLSFVPLTTVACPPIHPPQIPPEIRTPVLLGDALEFLSLADSGLWTASYKTRDSKGRVRTTSGNQSLL